MSSAQGNGHDPVIGCICTHGIGRQQPGRTADQVAEAVRLGVRRLEGSVDDLPASQGQQVAPQTCLRITTPGNGPFIAEFYDAHWDLLVEPPPMRVVLSWLARVGIIVAASLPAMLLTELHQERVRRGADDVAPVDTRVFLVVLLSFVALPVVLAGCLVVGPFALCFARVRATTHVVVSE